jgi:hypothetical protein
VACGGSTEPEQPAPQPAQEPAQEPVAWPEGTCLAVDELPLAAAEIDRIAAWVALIKPTDTLPALRRQALTHTVLERAALAVAYPEERARMRAEAELLGVALAEGLPLPQGRETGSATGTWQDLGLAVWGEAREAPPGAWIGPFEDSGRWLLLRTDEHIPGVVPGADLYQVELLTLPFVPTDLTRADVEAAIDASLLTIVDPSWADAVPAQWRLRMNGPE